MTNFTVERVKELAAQAMTAPSGMGDPFLKDYFESWAPYLRFLHLIVKEYRPRLAVELGVYLGTATGHMASADPDVPVIGVDLKLHERAREVAAHYRNITLIEGDSAESAPRVAATGLPVGLLFLDTEHDGDTPRREFEAYRGLLADEAIVCVDDLLGPDHLKARMQEFWRWLPVGEKIELHELHPYPNDTNPTPGFGAALWRKG